MLLGATTTVAPNASQKNWNCALDGCSPGSWCADDQQCKHHTTCHVEQTQVRAGDKSSDTVCRWNANSGVPCLHIACQHTNEKLINVVHRKSEAPQFKFHHCNHRDEGPDCKCRCHLDSREAQHVNNTPAPLDGGWSLFSEYGRCHSECTDETGPAGWKSKYRACSSPKPANGGAPCKGADWETVPCQDSTCDKPMPNCDWMFFRASDNTCQRAVTDVQYAQALDNEKIALKSAHGKYLVAEVGGAANANRGAARGWETWTFEWNGGTSVSFKGAHKKYLVAEPDGTANANRPVLGSWEKFTFDHVGNNKITLKGHHNKYLVAEQNGNLNANRDRAKGWEKFTVLEK